MFARCLTVLCLLSFGVARPAIAGARDSLILSNRQARIVIDLAGGSFAEFRFAGNELNPLSWSAPAPGDTNAQPHGHFLCLDRWGPPSVPESKLGMPYHGEASRVTWSAQQQRGHSFAELRAKLPIAGLSIKRTVQVLPIGAAFEVIEEVTNDNRLGRPLNSVQHPTIAPPFLDESTRVDCNGTCSFAQRSDTLNPEGTSSRWPFALTASGARSDIRLLTTNAEPNVVTCLIEEDYGWVTAATPKHGLLIGYVWPREDYPWVSLWRDVRNRKPVARGLEFGTTGLHQPFSILLQKGRIWDRPLFVYLDPGQTITLRYTAFLLKIPPDFKGVARLIVDRSSIRVIEQENSREYWVRDR